MRRFLSTLLALCVLCTTLGGCQEKKELPTMDVMTEEGWQDLPLVTMAIDVPWLSENLRSVLLEVPGSEREFHVSVEPLPRESAERSNCLTRMRTEMMAGKGPDLFVLSLRYSNFGVTASGSEFEFLEPLFAFPEKAMDNRLFLPLDEYMENAKLTDFDRLMSPLMELGHNEEGQQIIPLTYDFDVGMFDTAVFDIPMESTGTMQEMLDSGSLALEYFAGGMAGMPLSYFTREADYDKDTLLLTEEELFQQGMVWQELWERFRNGDFQPVIDTVEQGGFSMGPIGTFGDSQEEDQIVPYRNCDGGITAYVDIIGAINRNANYPEYAFRILDKLASENVMRAQTLYGWSGSMVSNMDLGGPDKPVWFPMTQEAYDQFLSMREEITCVKFITGLEQAVYETLYTPCLQGELEDESDVRAAAHKAYMTMKMMLAES